jgi:ribosomal protein L29|tara:strand:- start:287 stop:472 length:186 start_codon:yes stop_codon:yes gene_type:complete
MSVEQFAEELDKLNNKVVNLRPPKKYQSMAKAKNARELGALRRDLSTRRMLSGQLKYINKT